VPVLDAEPVVEAWLDTSKVDFAGVPLHVTVMYPFLPARSVRQAEVRCLAELTAGIAPFDFALTHLDTFPGVHYLAPQPAEPFVAITEAIRRRWPSCQPYGGVYDSVIPHMTVAFGDDPPADPAELEPFLPIVTRASELWLLGQTLGGWHTLQRFPFGSPPLARRWIHLGEQIKKYSTANMGLISGIFTLKRIFALFINLRFGSVCFQLCEVGNDSRIRK
jgi:hypothetical protein